jgi:hypothetical protein
MFCVYTLRQHPLYTLASLVAYTLLQPLRIPKGARPLFISLKVAHSAQEAPKKISGRSLIRKVKTIEVGFRGRRCHRALKFQKLLNYF